MKITIIILVILLLLYVLYKFISNKGKGIPILKATIRATDEKTYFVSIDDYGNGEKQNPIEYCGLVLHFINKMHYISRGANAIDRQLILGMLKNISDSNSLEKGIVLPVASIRIFEDSNFEKSGKIVTGTFFYSNGLYSRFIETNIPLGNYRNQFYNSCVALIFYVYNNIDDASRKVLLNYFKYIYIQYSEYRRGTSITDFMKLPGETVTATSF